MNKKSFRNLGIKPLPPKKERYPDYSLEDQAKGRCPYCLASVDMDCDCEKEEKK